EMPKATDNIDEIISFVSELIEKGHAYDSDGDVFFDVTSDPDYGELSNRSIDDQQGEGGDAASRKRHPSDFALWKSARDGEPSWESPWGNGRPGWHIECSAMSRRILGRSFDIHGGGLDLVFPHHENERAQSNCCHNIPMVKYWMHNGLMRAVSSAGKVGGRSDREQDNNQATVDTKISRSKGAGGLAELIERQGGDRIRFFLLRTHYRSTIVFSEEGIEEAGSALDTFARLFERVERISGKSVYDQPLITSRKEGELGDQSGELLTEVANLRNGFLSKMDDDFNTGGAISDIFDLARAINRFIDQQNLEDSSSR
ncbi:MAG TPA: cysteine--tRNA ligase, partial [Planctomycetaceae bacterium]|nr:cysteine--tRNA ligase [Planctomycetaceae bacterium]